MVAIYEKRAHEYVCNIIDVTKNPVVDRELDFESGTVFTKVLTQIFKEFRNFQTFFTQKTFKK